MIVAEPFAFAAINPLGDTDATFELLDEYVILTGGLTFVLFYGKNPLYKIIFSAVRTILLPGFKLMLPYSFGKSNKNPVKPKLYGVNDILSKK